MILKKNIEFDCDIGQFVKIKAIGLHGRVDSLSYNIDGKLYRVVYWCNGGRQQLWMYDWELEWLEDNI